MKLLCLFLFLISLLDSNLTVPLLKLALKVVCMSAHAMRLPGTLRTSAERSDTPNQSFQSFFFGPFLIYRPSR